MESLGAGLPGTFQPDQKRRCLALGEPAAGHRPAFYLRRAETLPYPPFEYITRQVQGDFTLQDQRDNNLYMDGGMVTSQADWSLNFDLGMTFHEWHGPVPVAHEAGRVRPGACSICCACNYGKPVRRLNWTLTVNPRLDTSPENYPLWGPDKADDYAGECGRENVPAGGVANTDAAAALAMRFCSASAAI